MLRTSNRTLWIAVAWFCWATGQTWALDEVSFQRDGQAHQVAGKVVVEAEDGGLLLLDRAGTMWAVTAEEKTAHSRNEVPFTLFPREELEARLLRELPEGFRIHSTAHYVIGYNTTPAYARWCGVLLERLQNAFTGYWKNRGFEIQEPAAPLVALVFSDPVSYGRYAERELGKATQAIVGYYSLASNRVTMYDLTGVDAASAGTKVSTTEQINRVLSRPEAERTVATIIHEATHQLAFNSGLLTRYADVPLWLSEGLAIYFESPDLKNSKGWRGIGHIHRSRLIEFRAALPSRAPDSLSTLVGEDSRFRDPKTAPPAYAEAWVLVHYLLKRYPKQFSEYLKLLSQKKPLLYDEPDKRLAELQTCLGKSVGELDLELLRYSQSLR